MKIRLFFYLSVTKHSDILLICMTARQELNVKNGFRRILDLPWKTNLLWLFSTIAHWKPETSQLVHKSWEHEVFLVVTSL